MKLLIILMTDAVSFKKAIKALPVLVWLVSFVCALFVFWKGAKGVNDVKAMEEWVAIVISKFLLYIYL